MPHDLLTEFLTLATVHVVAMVAPGPDFTLVVTKSVRQGRIAGIWVAAGIAAGLSIHILYTVLGVGALMHTSPWLLNAARALGATYIAWIAIQLLRARPAPLASPPDTDHTAACTSSTSAVNAQDSTPGSTVEAHGTDADAAAGKLFAMGFFTNATNPKVTLFFLAIFTSVVSAQTPLVVQAGYGLWMCLVNMIWFSLVAVLFSGERVRTLFLRLGHWFERLMGLLLMLFALGLIADIIH